MIGTAPWRSLLGLKAGSDRIYPLKWSLAEHPEEQAEIELFTALARAAAALNVTSCSVTAQIVRETPKYLVGLERPGD